MSSRKANRGAAILANPNPLATPTVTISLNQRNHHPTVKPKDSVETSVRLSLQKLLQNEYGNQYRAGRTVEDAQKAMEEVNPDLATRAPGVALSMLRLQLQGYMSGATPFDRKRNYRESPRLWWQHILELGDDDSDVLAVRK